MFKLTVKNQAEKIALADIPALRQSFAAASLMIIIGVALAISGSLWFLALPVMVSIGLLFSSMSGWCPMALFMEHMPWNKK